MPTWSAFQAATDVTNHDPDLADDRKVKRLFELKPIKVDEPVKLPCSARVRHQSGRLRHESSRNFRERLSRGKSTAQFPRS